MHPEFGNANVVGLPAGGWILGHFVEQKSLRATEAIEIKWGMHNASEWSHWKSQRGKKTITLLLSGKFAMQIRSGKRPKTITLSSPGDFVVWEDDNEHRWRAITDALVISVRWPSLLKPVTNARIRRK
jgi:hypothetical protein